MKKIDKLVKFAMSKYPPFNVGRKIGDYIIFSDRRILIKVPSIYLENKYEDLYDYPDVIPHHDKNDIKFIIEDCKTDFPYCKIGECIFDTFYFEKLVKISNLFNQYINVVLLQKINACVFYIGDIIILIMPSYIQDEGYPDITKKSNS